MMNDIQNELLPFVKTRQYKQFKETCDFVRSRRKIGLAYGEAGTGKSSAARQYATEQPPLAVNGVSPVFYLELEQTDKTDRAFYNTLVGAILHQPPENVTAKVASNEAKRLIDKYQFDMIILDEFHFLQDSGLEAVRTLWDKIGIGIMLVTMTQFRSVLQKTKHLQLHSRIIRFHPFDRLDEKQIRRELLPRVTTNSGITFDPEQKDADEIIQALLKATQGNFRRIVKVLDEASYLIELSIEENQLYEAGRIKQQPQPILQFSAEVILEAAARTEDMG
ncbi:MAG: ATP-binding protein [Chloroflexota bacterium]|nr:ATP-binding protein [Chloroflexota bacterium]